MMELTNKYNELKEGTLNESQSSKELQFGGNYFIFDI
jgi:hypothetical protein